MCKRPCALRKTDIIMHKIRVKNRISHSCIPHALVGLQSSLKNRNLLSCCFITLATSPPCQQLHRRQQSKQQHRDSSGLDPELSSCPLENDETRSIYWGHHVSWHLQRKMGNIPLQEYKYLERNINLNPFLGCLWLNPHATVKVSYNNCTELWHVQFVGFRLIDWSEQEAAEIHTGEKLTFPWEGTIPLRNNIHPFSSKTSRVKAGNSLWEPHTRWRLLCPSSHCSDDELQLSYWSSPCCCVGESSGSCFCFWASVHHKDVLFQSNLPDNPG